jgi:2-polyprenyl-3-methyl-5-hydroxy-6-metoxy-1,4-benzoquinol methylase
VSTICDLCGNIRFRILETASDGVRTVRCVDCGLIRLHPRPRFDAPAHYDDQYYRPWIEEQGRPRALLWQQRVDFLARFARPGRLLDVGCGDGSFLAVAQQRGWRVTGTEVSRWAAGTLCDDKGLQVQEGDLTQFESWTARFDVVTMWHVLEHMERPLENLRAARRLLTENGTIVVAVPNAGFTLFRLAYPFARLRPLRYYTPGERELHLYHFTPATLRAMLEEAGFRVIFEGADESALTVARKILERAARVLSALCRDNWSQALLVVARRRGPA